MVGHLWPRWLWIHSCHSYTPKCSGNFTSLNPSLKQKGWFRPTPGTEKKIWSFGRRNANLWMMDDGNNILAGDCYKRTLVVEL